MIVPILRKPGALSEWALVELQGDLESYQTVVDLSSNKFIGDLYYQKDADNTPILIIGMHILYGKETPLLKAIAVLEKKTEDNDGSNNTEYTVKAVVKKKIVFRGRPRPIVTGVPIST